jgi:hypothetical protein
MWWNEKYGKNSICGITQCRIRPGKNKNGLDRCLKLECGHMFYRTALLKWSEKFIFLNEFPTCPICRKKFYHSVLSI